MTFSDIANFACSKVGEVDAVSIQFATNAVMNRYRVLWDSYEWPATVDEVILTIPASQSNFFTDSIYSNILNAAWSMSLSLVPIPAVYRDIGWVRQNAPGLQLPNINAVIPAYYWRDQTMGIPMAQTAGAQLSNPAPLTSIVFNVYNSGGDQCTITIHGMALDASSGQIYEVTEVVTISQSGPGNVSPVHNFQEVFTLTKSVGASMIGVTINGQASPTFVMQAYERDFKFNQYLFFPIPTSTWYMCLKLKIRCPDLNSLQATESPAIQNLDDPLIAYCQADMLERQRQYSKAQQKQQEASMLVQGVKDEIREQSEYVAQITPDVYDITTINGRITWRPSSSFF